jgi:Cft2 family RNA processing exonuclease
MQARLGGSREVNALPWGEDHALNAETRVRLYPAGHILGSAQFWAERDGKSFLYTGDFKLRQGLSAETCATPHADVLVMECTFGLPRYAFPPQEEVMAAMRDFCCQAVDAGEVPVLFAYSLGKSQEILRGLIGAGLPVMLHPQTVKMTHVYEELGMTFPPHRPFELEEVKGHVVICPPAGKDSKWLNEITPRRTAAVTGWAMDPGAKYRYRCDALFALSDHADYPDLLRFVELVEPEEVLLVHGWTREFAQTLRARGVNAWALGRDNQLELALDSSLA